ncbi:MAG: phospho-N-acetylmuramoyl-pentapeptide-transferase, partial [Deltaproteobacteria bacterium]
MLYHLLYPLSDTFIVFNVFKYITFRTLGATLTTLIICLAFGPWLIRILSKKEIQQQIREDVPSRHLVKGETPTMGGTLLLLAITISTLLWANLSNRYVWIILLLTAGYGLIGLFDDYLKLIKKERKGLGVKGRYKLLAQLLLALIVGVVLYFDPNFPKILAVPFLKPEIFSPDLGWFYIVFALLVIAGTSNAVNLTDGLDGLAIGPVTIAAGTYLILAYVSGHTIIAKYLQITHVAGSGELSIFCGAMVGAGLGFLWYNTYPAQVFMGDVGSLALGGALGTVAVISKHELLLILVGGLFVLETLSVVFQVASFKWTGKRLFDMAPIHHHFELKGWAEPKIIVRFWIISIILALAALGT